MSDTVEHFKVPALGESVIEATVAKWCKREGDVVNMDELLVELETDKVTLEVAAPKTGVLKRIISPEGAVVNVGDVLGEIDVSESALSKVSSLSSNESQNNLKESKTIENQSEHNHIKLEKDSITSPSASKMLKENKIDSSHVEGTVKGGRITKADAINHISHQENAQNDRLERRSPLSRLRQRVAERLKFAQNTAAILTTFNEVDMSSVNSLRKKYKDVFEKKYGVKLGYMSFFMKACVHALQQFPMINSRIEEQEIITNNYIDMGVAVSAPQGLVVPVIRDVDVMSMEEIELAVAQFGKKAREGKITIEEMSGGTFSISNGGVFGSLLSTPILNPPQSAILGMHKIEDRPVAINGNVEIRPMIYLALSYDHRLIDGREAVSFLVQVKDSLENPGRFLLGV